MQNLQQQQHQQQLFGNRLGGSAAYGDFIKEIYTSIKNLAAMTNQITARLDSLTERINNLDAHLGNQDLGIQNIMTQIAELATQKTIANTQILSELDTLHSLDLLSGAGSGAGSDKPNSNKLQSSTLKSPATHKSSITFDSLDSSQNILTTLSSLEEQAEFEMLSDNHIGEDITTQFMIQPNTTNGNETDTTIGNFLILE